MACPTSTVIKGWTWEACGINKETVEKINMAINRPIS